MEKKSNIQIEGVKTTNTMKTGKHGRNSGELALIYKSKFTKYLKFFFLTDLFKKLENNIERFSSLRSILIIGDFSCRTNTQKYLEKSVPRR